MNRDLKIFLIGGKGCSMPGDVGLLILRVGCGGMMAVGHGIDKMFGEGRFGPPERFVTAVHNMGFPAPTAFAWMAALTELVAGVMVAAGLLTRVAAVALTFNMAVAAFGAHFSDPLFASGAGPSKEFALLYAVPFLALIFLGAGRFSVDGMLYREPPAA